MLIEKLRKEHPQHWKNATAIRVLTLDAVAAANSGHSGMPMGLSLIHISEPRDQRGSRMPSSA